MTAQELEVYFNTCLTKLQKKHVRMEQDYDLIQQTCIDLLKKTTQLNIQTEAEFIVMFGRFFHTLRKSEKWKLASDLAYGSKPIANLPLPVTNTEAESEEFKSFTNQEGCVDPWTSCTQRAIEFIHVIPYTHIREIMLDYYIAGYAIEEIAIRRKLGKSSIQRFLQAGVKHIQAYQFSH